MHRPFLDKMQFGIYSPLIAEPWTVMLFGH